MRDEFVFAFRSLRASPGFTLVAVMTLALGIGTSTAMFSVVHAVLLRPLPYPHQEQIVHLWEETSSFGFPENTPAPANFYDWKAQSRSFSRMTALRTWPYTLTGVGDAVRVAGMRTTADLFPLLGVQPVLGRVFTEKEDDVSAPRVAVLSHALWQDRFGGDRSIPGKTISLDGGAVTVIGVMPAGFQIPGYETDIWTPMALSPEDRAKRSSHFLQVMARLKPGVTLEQARSEMTGIAKRLEQQYPESNTKVGAVVVGLRQKLSGRQRPMLVALSAIVGFLLLISCANVAGLLVARAGGRQREMAVRAALGAGRGRLLLLQLAESGLLAAAACATGLALAAWTRDAVSRLLPETLYGARQIELNYAVMVFSMLAAAVTAVLAGLAPAIVTWRAREAGALRQGERGQMGGRGRMRQILVGTEVALSALALAGASLFLHSFIKLQRQDLGFEPDGLVTMRLLLPEKSYPRGERQVAFYQTVLEKIQALPGVTDAGWTYRLPTTMAGGASMVTFDGRPAPPRGQEPIVAHRYVSTSFLRTMRMRLTKGRMMEARDTQGMVFGVIVNEAFERRYFAGRPALEATFTDSSEGKRCRIVGVVEDVREYSLDEPARPVMYIPMQAVAYVRDLAIRTQDDPAAMAALVRREVKSQDGSLAISHVETMNEILSKAVAGPRLRMVLAALFAGLALLVTGVGLAGVVAQSVVERRAEIGLRVALGARQGDVMALVFRQGLFPAAIGLLAGLAASAALAKTVEAQLFEMNARDPGTFAVVAAVLILVTALALVEPARRALRIEPITVLRGD